MSDDHEIGPAPLGETELTELRHRVASLERQTSELGRACEQLDASRTRYRELFEAVRVPFLIHSDSGVIRDANRAAETLLGERIESLHGQNIDQFLVRDDRPKWHQHLSLARAANGIHGLELRLAGGDGELIPVRLDTAPHPGEAGAEHELLSVLLDLGDQRERLKQLAFFDALTKLPNRALLGDRLDRGLKSARRKRGGLGVLILDLDNFKILNDTQGHQVGDRLLQFVAEHLQILLRRNDTVARLGGDEFTLILEEVGDSAAVERIATKILERFRDEPFRHEHGIFQVSASIGIALYPEHAEDPDALMRCADIAMYRSKEAGGNCFSLYSEALGLRFHERVRLQGELAAALEQNQLRLVFQPQVRIEDGAIIGCEALLRWHHPTRGCIPPGSLLPVVTGTQLMSRLACWVIDEARRHGTRWVQAGFAAMRIAVNLSGSQLTRRDLRAVIEGLGAPDSERRVMIDIELTETILLRRGDEATQLLASLKNAGVRISIDDFGTGCSSLADLRRLPIDILKIDQSFIAGIPDDPDARTITRTIIQMARSLGMQVIAEGVESAAQLEFLRAHGCDAYQGFLFSAPLEADGLLDLLQRQDAG